jgi:hypothetical protein
VTKFTWPEAATIVSAAADSKLAINAEEAELFLEVAKALMKTSVQQKIGLTFDWYEEKDS